MHYRRHCFYFTKKNVECCVYCSCSFKNILSNLIYTLIWCLNITRPLCATTAAVVYRKNGEKNWYQIREVQLITWSALGPDALNTDMTLLLICDRKCQRRSLITVETRSVSTHVAFSADGSLIYFNCFIWKNIGLDVSLRPSVLLFLRNFRLRNLWKDFD